MNNYKSKAKYWEHKLNHTEAWQQSLATYRFKKYDEYQQLAYQAAMDHLRGEDHG